MIWRLIVSHAPSGESELTCQVDERHARRAMWVEEPEHALQQGAHAGSTGSKVAAR